MCLCQAVNLRKPRSAQSTGLDSSDTTSTWQLGNSRLANLSYVAQTRAHLTAGTHIRLRSPSQCRSHLMHGHLELPLSSPYIAKATFWAGPTARFCDNLSRSWAKLGNCLKAARKGRVYDGPPQPPTHLQAAESSETTPL